MLLFIYRFAQMHTENKAMFVLFQADLNPEIKL